jgi:hypothetical protein
VTLSLLGVIQDAKKIAEADGRDWFQLSADAMDRYMALAAEKLGEPAPAKNADHDWKFLTSHGDDAPGQSKDTYSQCTRCDMVKHDYAHGGGQTSPNYPVYYLAGKTHGAYHDPPCVSLRAEVEDLKRVRDIELGSVAASAEEAFEEADERASAYERWAEETAGELGCEAEWSNLHDHFQCIRGAALTDRSYRHSADETMADLHREVEKLRAVVEVARSFVAGLSDKTPVSVVPLVCAVESLGSETR